MILAIDVDYQDNTAYIAGVAFEHFSDTTELTTYTSQLHNILPYQPGQFYQRELPCILKLLEEHNLTPNTLIIDGFVWLDGKSKKGLGAHLYDALQKKTPIIGVAKGSFNRISDDYCVYLGDSQKPLYITCIDIPLNQAIEAIKHMSGNNRMPDLIKKADTLCRELGKQHASELPT